MLKNCTNAMILMYFTARFFIFGINILCTFLHCNNPRGQLIIVQPIMYIKLEFIISLDRGRSNGKGECGIAVYAIRCGFPFHPKYHTCAADPK